MKIKVEYSTIFRKLTGKENEYLSFCAEKTILELLDYLMKKYGNDMREAICMDRDRKVFAVILIYNKKTTAALSQPLADGDVITMIPRIGGG